MDVQKVQSLVDTHSGVRALVRRVKQRKNDANFTTADTVQWFVDDSGEQIGRGSAVDALRELANAGCGDFKVGRGSQKTRIIWAESPLKMLAAIAVAPVVGDLIEQKIDGNELKANAVEPVNIQTFRFDFPLRQSFPVTLSLPSDMTVDERKRLSDVILTLPASA